MDGFIINNGILEKYEGNERQIIIPEGVKAIGEYAFSYCTDIKAAVIPEGVEYIGEGAFSHCRGLISVNIPSSVTCIDDMAFSECRSLARMTIPDTVKKLGCAVLERCTGIKELYFLADSDNIARTMEYHDLFCGWGPFSGIRGKCRIESHYPLTGFETVFMPGMRLDDVYDEQLTLYMEYFLTCPKLFCEDEREKYLTLIAENRENIIRDIISKGLVYSLAGAIKERLIPAAELDSYIELANSKGLTEIQIMLMEHGKSFPRKIELRL